MSIYQKCAHEYLPEICTARVSIPEVQNEKLPEQLKEYYSNPDELLKNIQERFAVLRLKGNVAQDF